jgi:1-deoxy-D-xylulose-5-phosphate reductoisomerase
MKTIAILGSTGSIGISTLSVLADHSDQYQIFALTGHRRIETLVQQCLTYKPRYAVVADDIGAESFKQLTRSVQLDTELLVGSEGLACVAAHPEVDIVMAAIVGAAGLDSTLAAIQAGKKVLLANKETLVMAGDLVLAQRAQSNAQLLPVDSEHNAIFQCLPETFSAGRLFTAATNQAHNQKDIAVHKIVLTASGGATRDLPLEQLTNVSAEFACTHPNWSMGKKITVDSATMMNKALELIEAHYLFGLPKEKLAVVLHPQSIVHSMVYYTDGSVIAQLGVPDMRTPIAAALAWPKRLSTQVKTLDLTELPALSFSELDQKRYACLDLAYEALRIGGFAATVLNAANEIAVAAFLKQQIGFTDIYHLNEAMLKKAPSGQAHTIGDVKAVDQNTRERAHFWIERERLKKRIF